MLILCCFQAFSQKNTSKIDFQGHRGCRGLYPENTITAMIEALKMGVTTLEMDVVITKDKQVVLSHEPFMAHEISTSPDGMFLNETTEMQFNIYKMNYNELEKWDVGLKPHPRFPNQQKIAAAKPRLSEVIDSVESYIKIHKLKPIQYNIETKSDPAGDDVFHPKPDEFVSLLLGVLNEKNILERCIIQSFDVRTLQIIHRENPEVKLAYLLEKTNAKDLNRQLTKLGFIPHILSPEYPSVNQELVALCKKKKMSLIVWTVNDVDSIQKLIKLGVNGIISDYPNLYLQ